MSSFTSPLIATPLPDGVNWKLEEEFEYHVGAEESDDIIHVTKGFVTDFASIPQLLITLIGIAAAIVGYILGFLWLFIIGIVFVFISVQLPRSGVYGKAAVIHDYIYQTHVRTRKEADDIFREAMGVLRVSIWKIFLMYWSVRLFGWLAWRPKVRKVSKYLQYRY
jgi:hypothetical protein